MKLFKSKKRILFAAGILIVIIVVVLNLSGSDEALTAYHRAAALEPERADVGYASADIYLKQGRPQRYHHGRATLKDWLRV